MKTKAITIIVLLVMNAVCAQVVTDKWPSIKSFNEVMSQTFHQAEEGNLGPVKARSEELMNKAAAILKSDIPAEYRTSFILASAEKLQVKSKALNKLVLAKAPDAEITKLFTELHNIFHNIVGTSPVEKL